MKRSAFLREVAQKGCVLHRHDGRLDLYLNPANGRKAPVPRHDEIKDSLCRVIRKQLDLELLNEMPLQTRREIPAPLLQVCNREPKRAARTSFPGPGNMAGSQLAPSSLPAHSVLGFARSSG